MPAPCGGIVGQQLHFRVHVFGCDKSSGKFACEFSHQVFDVAGKPLLEKPVVNVVRCDESVLVKDACPTFWGNVVLSRPGDFTLRLTAHDLIGGGTATFAAPLHIAEP